MLENASETTVQLEELINIQTSQEWVDKAMQNIEWLLIDHANCEKKAALTAINMIFKYDAKYPQMINFLSRVIREEMFHYRQVIKMIKKLNFNFYFLPAGIYAKELYAQIHKQEPKKLIDTLLVATLIEARSCERFSKIAPFLAQDYSALSEFYKNLAIAESEHFKKYYFYALELKDIAGYTKEDLNNRLEFFKTFEAGLINNIELDFRFHS